MSGPNITFEGEDEQELRVMVNGVEVYSTDYDSVGYSGIEAVKDAALAVAKELGTQLNFFVDHSHAPQPDLPFTPDFEGAARIICQYFSHGDMRGITPETTTYELELDSLDEIELIMALEDEFNIEISDEDAEKLLTVGEIGTYLEQHVKR